MMELKICVIFVTLLVCSLRAEKVKLNSEITIEKYLESSKKDYSGKITSVVIANPSGTRLVFTYNMYKDGGKGTNTHTIKIDGVETPGVIPLSNYQSTLNNDISNNVDDLVFHGIFLNDNEIVLEFEPNRGENPGYASVLDVKENSLAISKKSPEVTFTHSSLYLQTYVSSDHKNGLVVIGEISLFIIDSQNLLSSRQFAPTPLGSDMVFSLTFDKRSESNFMFASIMSGFRIYDHTAGSDGDDPAEMEVFKSEVLSLCFSNIEQNYQDMTKALTTLRRVMPLRLLEANSEDIVGTRRILSEQEKGILMYYDLQDPYSYGLRLLAKAPGTLDGFETISNSLSNIIETNYFITILMDDGPLNNEAKYLYMADTSPATLSLGSVIDLPVFKIDSAAKTFLPTDVKFGMITSIARLMQGENKFALSVLHGGDSFGAINQDLGTFVILDFKKNCHESCSTCYQVYNPESCLTCKEGYELKPIGVSENGRATGTCSKIVEEEIGDGGNGDEEDSEISLKFPITALCGSNPIKGCSQCSNFHVGKCATCSNQLGLADYVDDYSAGSKCVDCPISGCLKCEMAPGGQERKCTKCSEGKSLVQLSGGKQSCYAQLISMIPVVLSLFNFNRV